MNVFCPMSALPQAVFTPVMMLEEAFATVNVVVTGETPATVAVTLPLPNAPSVTVVEARPCAFVTAEAGFTVAFVAVNPTVAPATTAPCASVASTVKGDGSAAPGAPLAAKPLTNVSLVTGAGAVPPNPNFV